MTHQPPRRAAIAPVHLAPWCWAAASAAGLVLVYRLCVDTVRGQVLDDRLAWAVTRVLAAWTTEAESLLHQLSFTRCALVVVALAVSAAVAGRGRHAVGVVGCAAGVEGTAEVLKALLVRPELVTAATNSLPSGHVAAVGALLAAAVVASPPSRRRWTVAAGLPLVVLTGLAVVVAGWHRPSDVLAAVLLSVCGCAVTIAVCDVPHSGTRGRLRPVAQVTHKPPTEASTRSGPRPVWR